ncbi:hypothetical protein L3Y34_019683 [Caenorhabditis briggsae]|uniref:EGF-like domain-containing protein n=1 Tax=Caenorhabditis briggsae TaxID=6238 RepID=A0AAE9DNV4_CAEBR|nr:hypothetical protein L3Y34_019683 [Caenorhabditis briggsae]
MQMEIAEIPNIPAQGFLNNFLQGNGEDGEEINEQAVAQARDAMLRQARQQVESECPTWISTNAKIQRSCDCDLGFTGRTCGVVDPNPAPISRFSPIPEVSAFILALSAALFLIITLVFCLQSCCIRYSKRKSVEDSSARNIQMTTRMETY